MMGAGKSTVGRALAKRLNWSFVDLDHEIESITGVRIPVIFEIEGESGFRRRESQVLSDLVNRNCMVLATGGGVVIDPANRALLKSHGDVIYLRASADDLYMRTKNDKSRPLLQTDNPRQRIAELLQIREGLYEDVAGFRVNTGRQPVGQIAQNIIATLGLRAAEGDEAAQE
jgi:shikimate kinase